MRSRESTSPTLRLPNEKTHISKEILSVSRDVRTDNGYRVELQTQTKKEETSKETIEIDVQSRVMRRSIKIPVLLCILLFHQISAQAQQQQKPEDAGHKTNSEIRPLPPTPVPPTLPPAAADTDNRTIATPDKDSQQAPNQNTVLNNKWDHFAIILSAVATAIIAIFTWLTWGIYKGQLQTTKLTERAWLVADIGAITKTPKEGLFQVFVEVRNNGKTPAWVTAAGSRGWCKTEQKPLPETPKYTEMGPFTKDGQLLPPTASLPQGITLQQAHINTALKDGGAIYMFGYVEYRDVYGGAHLTRYCYQTKPTLDLNHPDPLDFYISGPEEYLKAT